MRNVEEYFSREKKVFGVVSLLGAGTFLLVNHYLYFGSLEFFDGFPSHESVGLLSIVGGFIFLISMFDFSYPAWLREKNNKKIVGKIINQIIKK